jgi:hypothetical protein
MSANRPQANTTLKAVLSECVCRYGERLDRKQDDIRLRNMRIKTQTCRTPKKVLEERCVIIVGPQLLDVMVESVETGSGKHSRLAHRSAKPVFPLPCLSNEGFRTAEHSANRTAQSLAEIDPGTIPSFTVIRGTNTGRDDGVEQPCAVDVAP